MAQSRSLGRPGVRIQKLKSGLRAAAVPVPGSSFVSLAIAVPAGSRSERTDQHGLAHFTEHMLFRGSARYPSTHLLNHAIELLGDGLQGGTTREFSLYTTETPRENLEELLGVLADFFQNPRFSEIDKEKRVVLEEIREEVDERGRESGADNITRMALQGSHPIAHPILGRAADLKCATIESLHEFHATHYRTDNLVIVAAGNIKPEPFFRNLDRIWTEVAPAREPMRKARRAAPKSGRPGGKARQRVPAEKFRERVEFRRQAGSQIDVLFCFLGRGEEDPDRLSRLALERVLDDGLSSRLQRRLCERRGLLYDISLSVDSCTDVSFFDLGFRIEPTSVVAALDEIFAEFRSLQKELVGEDELERVKSRMRREVRLMFETPRYLAARVAETVALGLPMPLGREDWLKRIEQITRESIRLEARHVFRLDRMAGAIEGPVTPSIKKRILDACARGLR